MEDAGGQRIHKAIRGRPLPDVFEVPVRTQSPVITTAPVFTVGSSRVAGSGAPNTYAIEDRILFTINAYFHDIECITTGLPLDPQFVSRGAPKSRLSCVNCGIQGQFIRISNNKEVTGLHILCHSGHYILTAGRDLPDFGKIEAKISTLLQFSLPNAHFQKGGAILPDTRSVGKNVLETTGAAFDVRINAG